MGLMLRDAALHCPLRHGLLGTLRLKYARLAMQLQWHTALAQLEAAARCNRFQQVRLMQMLATARSNKDVEGKSGCKGKGLHTNLSPLGHL